MNFPPFDLPEQVGDIYALLDIPREGRVTIAHATIDRSRHWFLVAGHYWFPVFSIESAYRSTGATRIIRISRAHAGLATNARMHLPTKYMADVAGQEWYVREDAVETCTDIAEKPEAQSAGRTYCNTCGRYQWLDRYEQCPVASTLRLPAVGGTVWRGKSVTELENSELIEALEHTRQVLEAERQQLAQTRRLLSARAGLD